MQGETTGTAQAPSIVVGITHPQTCLTLTGRLRALREAGFQVTLVSSPGALLDRTIHRERVRAVPLPMKRTIAPVADLVSLLRLVRILLKIKPILTEFSTPKAGLLGNLAAWFCRVPARVYMLRGLKLETAVGFKRHLLLAMERVAARCAHVVLCNSASLRERALELNLAPASKLHLLEEGSTNGVDVARFSPGESDVRSQLGIPDHVPVVGFAGRLTRDKGVPELMDAFWEILKAEPETRLLLVGWFDISEDALDEYLCARITTHPRIYYTGFVEDTADYYRAMDMLVLPTWREGFPNVVLEAAAIGLPVVTTLCTGSRDSVVPEVTGFLIPPGYPEAIKEAVLTLIRNPERRRRMGQAARRWVLEHYVDRHVMELTIKFYKRLIEDTDASKVRRDARKASRQLRE